MSKKHTNAKKFRNKSTHLELPSFKDEKNLYIFQQLEAKAHKAINSQKIFLIVGGFDIIRRELISRGWIEKNTNLGKNQLTEKMVSETVGCYDKTVEVLSHLVKNSTVHFIWASKYFNELLININAISMYRNRINRMRTSDFTLKEGLHNLAENIQWHTVENVSELNYPRSYLIMNSCQREFFSTVFGVSTIISFLFYLNDQENFDSLFDANGEVSIELIYESIERIELLIKIKQNFCIDSKKSAGNESKFAQQVDLVVNQRKKIRFPEFFNNFSIQKLRTKIKIAVCSIHFFWPDSKYDTNKNIW
jgi:hypothetical protein